MVKQKHVEWFQRGAWALRSLAGEYGTEDAFPTHEDWYACPLCLDGFTIEELETGELTVEHVPPKALGGHELVLTCRQCNHRAGGKFDGQAHAEDRIRQLFSGQNVRPETVTVTLNGISARAEMRASGQTGIFLSLISQMNNPADVALMEEYMRELSISRNSGIEITITPKIRYSPDRARISWVRTAYLTAFALFGWRYILKPTLQPIRDQLMNASDITLPMLSMDVIGESGECQGIWAVKKPAEQRSLLVVSGSHGIFLPLPNDQRNLAELAGNIGAEADGLVTLNFTGDLLSWPNGPLHLLDPPPITAQFGNS